jgi:energy-coupling factor transport system permease protein
VGVVARLARQLHPLAWWVWALALAVAASRTTNPVLLGLIIAVAGIVVANRRGDAPWALAFRWYLLAAALIVAMRVLFRVVFGGGGGEHILFVLPEIPLPAAAAGIRLFGPVAAEQVLAGAFDGLRLGAMLVCVGAANALANPKRVLKAVPGALSEVATAVVVAVSVAPQLVDSVLRVRRARRLRGGRDRGVRALRAIAIPVLVDAMDRSLRLAAAMDSRGFGRIGGRSRLARRISGVLLVVGLLGIGAGLYGVLDGTAPRLLGVPTLAAGAVVAVGGLAASGRGVRRSVYRPDRWRGAELLVAAAGLVAATAVYATGSIDPANLYPSLSPLAWPGTPALPVAGLLVAALPAWLTPPAPHIAGPAVAPPMPARSAESAPDENAVPAGGVR